MTTTIALNKSKILELLSQNKLKELFTQHLGWNNFSQSMHVQVEGTTYVLTGIVEKEGFAIYEHVNNGSEPIKYSLRKKISNKLAKTQLEHLIVFTEKNEQVWQWIKRAAKNSPAVTRSEIYNPAKQSGEKLYQKLEKLFFGWDDYTITDVTQRINDSLNKDRVTKKFYEEFKKNKDNFSEFIKGMKEAVDKEWYSSLMLNRLMFIYFIQKKGFLNNDLNYMRTKLNEIQDKYGDNKFYSFYREFLLVLFHEGFARELDKRSAETMQLIGKIPYLNGGLFDVHELERKYPDIIIPDSAFEKIFDFFDKYDWHLDDRPVSDDKQINPDVIGHIFEKYINQKQMGAYYTKEDITEYISKNTIIPYLFEEAKKKCEVAFKETSYIWQMLKDNPDKYIYDAVKKGCEFELPKNIACGINDVSRRTEWNTPALEEYALPTEIWRETIERRNRYFEIKSKLESGEINSINDFITYNLDIRQFAEDVITNAESSDVVKAFYYTIAGHIGEKSNEKEIPAMSILDPTCGSGAFLFAGLNILEPLYDACIDKMYDFKHEKPDAYKEFDSILADIEKHPNREYFIYKSIILNNLYGVDIMKEAAEIAKLRLFLKLASCAEVDYKKENYGLETLPDIDFNIRAGNSLVGFANYDEVKDAVSFSNLSGQRALIFDDPMPKIDEKAQLAALAYRRFKDTQLLSGTHDELVTAKKDLQQRLDNLNSELNQYMAKRYEIDINKKEDYKKWLNTHEPFNWFVEFYDVIHNRGGFDVIIGNPPYVEYNPKKFNYLIDNNKFNVYESKNLYSYINELSKKIVHTYARFGLIIQISSISTPNMQSLVKEIKKETKIHWISNYATRPSYLFDGVCMNLTIHLSQKYDKTVDNLKIYTTQYIRWYKDYREFLFKNITYNQTVQKDYLFEYSIPKFETYRDKEILSKILKQNKKMSAYLQPNKILTKQEMFYRTAGGRYFKIFYDNDFKTESKCNKSKFFHEKYNKYVLISILSSNLWWFYYTLHFDMYNCTDYMIFNFPFDYDNCCYNSKLEILGIEYCKSLSLNAEYKKQNYETTGNRGQMIFKPSLSKQIIDQIDKILAKHYGFTDEELDYIINYDIKYRMGDSLNGDNNDEE